MTEPNETVQSQLSAFIDSELPQDETELLARRLSRDVELQQSLSRYLLIGEALRAPAQGRMSNVSRDFSTRIAAAIEQDAVPEITTAITAKVSRPWLKPAVGMTLAASVATVAIMSISTLQSVNHLVPVAQMAANPIVNSTQLSSTSANSYVVPVATTAPSAPISAARLTNYVVAHSEFTSPLGRRNMMTGFVTNDQQVTDADETVEETDKTQ